MWEFFFVTTDVFALSFGFSKNRSLNSDYLSPYFKIRPMLLLTASFSRSASSSERYL
jgi:hypothetical protein